MLVRFYVPDVQEAISATSGCVGGGGIGGEKPLRRLQGVFFGGVSAVVSSGLVFSTVGDGKVW